LAPDRPSDEQSGARGDVVAIIAAEPGADAPPEPGHKPLAAWSVEALGRVAAVGRIVVAVAPGARAPEGSLAVVREGDLVATLEAALAIAGPCETVIVHDPQRPLGTPEVFERALTELREHRCDAVVAATPVTDTLKRVDGSGRTVETIDRSEMWELQTPQAYHAGALRAALAQARLRAEPIGYALLPARLGGRVRVVGLPRESLRVQRPADARVAEQLLRQGGAA
jgi:2-C-methyl-D-erythritol 4-phosphate cytidylyltransferase